MFAVSSFRMVYASVWDFRFNHIPLPRGVGTLGFTYVDGEGMRSFVDAVATRKAGWGTLGAGASGAPFDAVAGLGGAAGAHGRRGDNMV
jgi:hypothetical protein